MIMWAAIAKLIGGFGRYWMVTVLYQTGDSYSYHMWGEIFAQVWRGMQVPVSSSGQPGTAFTEVVTGFVYAPYTPSMLGGFIIFSSIAFAGLFLFFLAGRHWLAGYQLKMYGLAVFFAPSLIFWPSSIGKDALMVFFLGLASSGASRLLKFYQFSAIFLIAPGLYLAASIRSHVAAVLGIAIAFAALLGKAPKVRGVRQASRDDSGLCRRGGSIDPHLLQHLRRDRRWWRWDHGPGAISLRRVRSDCDRRLAGRWRGGQPGSTTGRHHQGPLPSADLRSRQRPGSPRPRWKARPCSQSRFGTSLRCGETRDDSARSRI